MRNDYSRLSATESLAKGRAAAKWAKEKNGDPLDLMRALQELRRDRKNMDPQDIPTGKRFIHPREAAANPATMTDQDKRWQRVLEIVEWRDPYAGLYLAGSRFSHTSRGVGGASPTIHYSVVSEYPALALNRSPLMDRIHEAVHEVSGYRLHPVASWDGTAPDPAWQEAIDKAAGVIRDTFPTDDDGDAMGTPAPPEGQEETLSMKTEVHEDQMTMEDN